MITKLHAQNKIRLFPILIRQRIYADRKKVVAQNKGKGNYKITEPEREKLDQISKIFLPSSEIIIKAVKRDFIIPDEYVLLFFT